MFLLLLILTTWARIGAEWEDNFIVNASHTLAKGENLTNCWICHTNPETPSGFNTHIKAYPLSNQSLIQFLNSSTTYPIRSPFSLRVIWERNPPFCLRLTPYLTQSFNFSQTSLKCNSTVCTPCYNETHAPAVNIFELLAEKPENIDTLTEEKAFKPLNWSNIVCQPNFASPCVPNATHCCLGHENIPEFNNNTACRGWKLGNPMVGLVPTFDKPPAAGQAVSNLGPFKDCINISSTLLAPYFSKNHTLIPAPEGLVWLCGTSSNWLTARSEQLEAIAYSSLDNSIHGGDCTLGTLAPTGMKVLRSAPPTRTRRAFGLVVAGSVAAVAALAPWGGFAYHELTLKELTTRLEETLVSTADGLAGLSRSLDSLANVVLDNRIALDYLLAEQGGVCAVINKTCCTYVNNSGLIETNIQKLYEQAKWLHQYNQKKTEASSAFFSMFDGILPYLLPLLGPLLGLLLLLSFGPMIYNKIMAFIKQQIEAIKIQQIQVHYHRLEQAEQGNPYFDTMA
ncbi:endogenous retrovirus group V member 2 Env polyprotein-like [Molossus nigricans]